MTPFSARALDRGLAGALVGLARHAEAKLTPPAGVERLSEVRAEVGGETARIVRRARRPAAVR